MTGLCLLGALLLGLAVWAVAGEDDEPTAITVAVAELTAPAEAVGKGRIEIVRTGERTWLKLQVRDLQEEPDELILTKGPTDDPVVILVDGEDGDSDYTLRSAILNGDAEVRHGDTVLLSGTIAPES